MTEHRDAINPPRPVRTPPASAEARAIAQGDESYAEFQRNLQAQIDGNKPTWFEVLRSLFRGK